jgi:hypothetical protein
MKLPKKTKKNPKPNPNNQTKVKNKKKRIQKKKKNLIDVEAFNKMSKEEQNEILSKRVATKKVRCKNWPNCKDPNCIYAHPTQTVSINFNFIILIK